MKIEWSRNYFIYLILTAAILAGVYYAGLKFYVAPIQADVAQLQTSLKNEEAILLSLRNKKEQHQTISLSSSRELQRYLPVLPVTDQVLIGLERSEAVSNSLIQSIVIRDAETEQENQNDQQNQSEELLPLAGVKTVKVNLQVMSPSFEDLMRFLNELDRLPRLISIDSISLQNPESAETAMNFVIAFSAYYYPKLVTLQEELPQYHYGPPANKENPFDDSATPLEGENVEPYPEQENNSTDQTQDSQGNSSEENPRITDWIEHEVAPNETLFRVIVHYYGQYNQQLKEEVKQFNNMTSDTIFAGEKLKIPSF